MSCEINLICPGFVTLETLIEILSKEWEGVETTLPGVLEYQISQLNHNLRIYELVPSKDVLAEYLNNDYFPEEIATKITKDYRFFCVVYNDLELAKDVLHTLLEKLVLVGKTVWFESDFGWFVEARKLLHELQSNDNFNWLTEDIPANLQ